MVGMLEQLARWGVPQVELVRRSRMDLSTLKKINAGMPVRMTSLVRAQMAFEELKEEAKIKPHRRSNGA